MGLFRKAKIHIENLHRTDLVNCNHFRERNTVNFVKISGLVAVFHDNLQTGEIPPFVEFLCYIAIIDTAVDQTFTIFICL